MIIVVDSGKPFTIPFPSRLHFHRKGRNGIPLMIIISSIVAYIIVWCSGNVFILNLFLLGSSIPVGCYKIIRSIGIIIYLVVEMLGCIVISPGSRAFGVEQDIA